MALWKVKPLEVSYGPDSSAADLTEAFLQFALRESESKKSRERDDKILLAGFLERETVRKESDIDATEKKLEAKIEELQNISGVLYSLPEVDKTGGTAQQIERDINLPLVKGLRKLTGDLTEEHKRLDKHIGVVLGEIEDAKKVQDWYSGAGHTYEGGLERHRWDFGDFTDPEFEEYAEEFGIPKGTDRSAFTKGAIAGGKSLLGHRIQGLNVALDQARTAELNAKVSEYNYKRTLSGATREDMEALQQSRDKHIYNLIKPYSITAGNTGLNRATSAALKLADLEEEDKGYDDALKVSNTELEYVGASITYNVKARASNIELGAEIVTGNMRFQKSSEQETQLSRTDYTGLTRSYEKIYYHAMHNEKQLKGAGLKDYKRRVSEIVGMRYDYFMQDFYPSLERGLENQDKDALTLTTGTLNKAVSSDGYSTFDEHFRDLYRSALMSKGVSGETEFIDKHQMKLWKIASEKYGYTKEEFIQYLNDF